MDQHLPIFVYGTLLYGFSNHQIYIAPYPHQSYPAKIRGRIYHLPEGYPALVRSGEPGSDEWVYGELLLFPPEVFAQVLGGLDQLEEFYAPLDVSNEYERELVKATLLDRGDQYLAYTYVMRGEKEVSTIEKGTPVPAGDWRKFVQSGS